MTRNWQESFDRLEHSRREEQQLREEDERQIRIAKAACEHASLDVASAEGFMLADDGSGQAIDLAERLALPEPAASPKPDKPRKAGAKTVTRTPAKASPGKRAAPRRKAGVAQPRKAKAKVAKPRTTAPKVARQKTTASPPAESLVAELVAAPQPATSPPAISLPRGTSPAAPEPLLITPLPRSASLARYNKRGLFGLIGSWLHLAARRPKVPESLRRLARKQGAPREDLAALRQENQALRRELEELRARQAETPPWATEAATTPAGDVPARPRRRGGILG